MSCHRSFKRALPSWRWLGASGVLLLYLLTATPLAPVLTALVAMAEGTHDVGLQPTAHGIQLVLHHHCLNPPTHRYGLMARVLRLAPERASGGQTDHVIPFSAKAASDQAPALATDFAPDSWVPELSSLWQFPPRTGRVIVRLADHPHPVQDSGDSWLSIGSTVRLL